MIEIKEGNYYVGTWFCGNGVNKDWMGMVYKEKGEWILQYRWRYYRGKNQEEKDDPFNTQDRKSWYAMKADGTEISEEEMIQHIEMIGKIIELEMGNPMERVLYQTSDIQKVMWKLRAQPWSFTKEEKIDE